MAKYQNVGTPRFYVDYVQWGLSTGLIKTSLPTENENNEAESEGFGGGGSYNENSHEFLFDRPHSSLPDIVKLFSLNPAENVMSLPKSDTNSSLRELSINLQYASINDWAINYGMVLNHNLKNAEAYLRFRGLNMLYDDDDSIDDNPLVNYIDGSQNPEYNGWSLAELSNFDTEYHDAINVRLKYLNNSNTTNIKIGCISIGQFYDMPHSPDLDLTMSKEFGGVKHKYNQGGALLTHANYTHPPVWGEGEAWGLYDASLNNLKNRRAGRRFWNLKFSYISASDLMADIEMLNIHPNDENDNPQGYEGYLGTNNFFSFMQKTLGGNLKFIFQPDNTDFNSDGFAICTLDQDSISIKQVAHNTYNISLKIVEVW